MMAEVMLHLNTAVNVLKKRFTERIKCIETGTIRSYSEHHGSTLVISKALGDKGSLISVDYKPKSMVISKDICKNVTNVQWVLSDSITYLKQNQEKFHLAFLDSQNNPDFIFEEFKLVLPKMIAGGIIIVDDAGVDVDGKILTNTIQVKGHRVSGLLKSLGCDNYVVFAPYHGSQLWIDTTKITCERMLTKIAKG